MLQLLKALTRKVLDLRHARTIGVGLLIFGVGVILTAGDPAAAQIADAGQALLDELVAYGPTVAGLGILVCGVGMIASLQGALYAGVPMVVGGTIVSLVPDIQALLGFA
jgi:hypothetical protein